MTDLLLTLSGYIILLPVVFAIRQASFRNAPLPRKLVLTAYTLQLITLLFLPVTVYYAFGLLTLAFLYYCWKERPSFRITPLACVAFAYWLWHVISITWSPAPLKGLQFVVDQLPPLVLCLVPCWISFTREEGIDIIRPFCYSACIFIGLSLLSAAITFIESSPGPISQWPLLNPAGRFAGREFFYDATFRFMHYHHPSYNSLPLFLAVLLAVWLSRNKCFPIALTILMMVLMPVVGFLAQSRMAILFSVIIWLVCLVYIMPSLRARIITTTGIVVAGLAITIAVWPQLQAMERDGVREELTDFTLRYIHEKPWLGAGAGAMNPIEMGRTIGVNWWPRIGIIDTSMPVEEWPYKTKMLPHNQFLADWVHAGILSMLLCVALYITVGYNCFKKRDFPASVFMLIFVVFSFLEVPLFITKGLYLFAVVGSLSAAIQK